MRAQEIRGLLGGLVAGVLGAQDRERDDRLAGGLVVTASHNPKEYNGYKVYGPAGTQINTPVDGLIADEILKVAEETQAPTLANLNECMSKGIVKEFGDEMLTSYIKDVQGLNTFASTPVHGKDAPISIAYSPLHGVGAPSIERLSKKVVGLTEGVNFWISEEQRKPDGAFPTLEFPSKSSPSTSLSMSLAPSLFSHFCSHFLHS